MFKNLLWQGKLSKLKKQIEKHISYPKKRREALARLNNYFMKNRSRMQYTCCRNLNLPTGSGCAESAIRRVINLRLKSPGTFWKPETAESMLFLRSQLLSGRWNIMIDNIFRLMLDSRVLIDQHLNQGMKQGFPSLADIMNKFKESEIDRNKRLYEVFGRVRFFSWWRRRELNLCQFTNDADWQMDATLALHLPQNHFKTRWLIRCCQPGSSVPWFMISRYPA
jgi:hypothetical protein